MASVVFDRAVGVTVLAAIGLVTLLIPSPLAGLGGNRAIAFALFSCICAGAVASLVLAKLFARIFEHWPYTRWAGKLAASANFVLLGSGAGAAIVGSSFAIHGLSILAIWLLGVSAGLPLTPADAAVLFTVMLGVALIPVSISGWGVRELAVTALLGEKGIAVEQSLLFSLSFGILMLVAALPGSVVWALYSPGKPLVQRCD